MSNFLLIPINENGVVVDPNIRTLVETAMSPELGFTDAFIYSHGWATDASGAMSLYNRFSLEFTRQLIVDATSLHDGPLKPLGIGLHWPTEITEDANTLPSFFGKAATVIEPLTFYTMEKRADVVGQQGAYALLRMILSKRDPSEPLRVHMLGHSFGCKVISSALEAVYQDIVGGTIPSPKNIVLNAVLLQGAFEAKQLDATQCYGDLQKLPMRMLVTTSGLDKALNQLFPLAHRAVDFFDHVDPKDAVALGAGGPTAATVAAFGGASTVDVGPGFSIAQSLALDGRLVVANLTALHAAHPENDVGLSGHHSDLDLTEVYNLVAGFLFQK